MKLCALSVDLDEVGNYRALHGLPQLCAAEAVYRCALPRLLSLAREQRVPLTLFAIGRDLEAEHACVALREASKQGHLVENHSYSHDYALSQRGHAAIHADLLRAQELIAGVTDRRPVGFRAPGYISSPAMRRAALDCGFVFDASALPSPPYQAAKLAKLAMLRLAGRDSVAILDAPKSALASRLPQRTLGGVWQLPMAVTRWLRLPVIGTSLTLAGRHGARSLLHGCFDLPLVSLELHGIDVLDATDGLADLIAHQPDVRVPLARKLRALVDAVQEMRAAGYRFVSLADAVEELEAD